MVKYCEIFVENTKKLCFSWNNMLLGGGGEVVNSLGKKTHPMLFLQFRGPLGLCISILIDTKHNFNSDYYDSCELLLCLYTPKLMM